MNIVNRLSGYSLTPIAWPLVDQNDDGIRPAGAPDECFYCKQKVGQQHGRKCVTVKKTARFRCTIDVDIDVPHYWTKEQIESVHYEHGCEEVWEMMLHREFEGEQNVSYSCEFVGISDEAPRREIRDPEADA